MRSGPCLDACGFTAPSKARGEEAHARKHAVGCTARRVRIRWDKKVCNDLGFLHVACASIT